MALMLPIEDLIQSSFWGCQNLDKSRDTPLSLEKQIVNHQELLIEMLENLQKNGAENPLLMLLATELDPDLEIIEFGETEEVKY